nr:MAG TPA: hypothetical protein [Caudoviricetes sp.]
MNNPYSHPRFIAFNELRQILILNGTTSVLPVRPAQRLHNQLRRDNNLTITHAIATQRSILHSVNSRPTQVSSINIRVNTPTKRVNIKTQNIRLVTRRRLAFAHASARHQHERERRVLLHARQHANITRQHLPENTGNNILSQQPSAR